jgi:hypothetical protein
MKSDIEILKEKIARVEKDLIQTQMDNGGEKKRLTLIDYLDYLKDDLKMLENDERLRTGTK